MHRYGYLSLKTFYSYTLEKYLLLGIAFSKQKRYIFSLSLYQVDACAKQTKLTVLCQTKAPSKLHVRHFMYNKLFSDT